MIRKGTTGYSTPVRKLLGVESSHPGEQYKSGINIVVTKTRGRTGDASERVSSQSAGHVSVHSMQVVRFLRETCSRIHRHPHGAQKTAAATNRPRYPVRQVEERNANPAWICAMTAITDLGHLS